MKSVGLVHYLKQYSSSYERCTVVLTMNYVLGTWVGLQYWIYWITNAVQYHRYK